MPNNDNINKQELFMIYDNYTTFNPYLFSVWDVHRTSKYTTLKNDLLSSALYCFIRTVSGTGIVITTEGTFKLTEGTLLLIRENSIIEYIADNGPWNYNWYNFRTETPIPFFELNKIYNIVFTHTETQLKNEMFIAMKHYDEYNIRLTGALFLEIIFRWITICRDESDNVSEHLLNIKQIVSFINNNINQQLSINELASKCFLSERQFRVVFKNYTGLSPKKYICKQKLKKTALLLRTSSKTINQIALELNYSSPFHLSRDFKNQFGLSPKEYREQKSF